MLRRVLATAVIFCEGAQAFTGLGGLSCDWGIDGATDVRRSVRVTCIAITGPDESRKKMKD